MTNFPEEPLDSPAGYHATSKPGATLCNGRWTIIRKLGWGPRSSTWLAVDARDPENIEALKIFTVQATQDAASTNERDLLSGALKEDFHALPSLRDSFYEESEKGKHLVLVFHPLGASVESLRVANGGSLALPAVKKIVAGVLEPLVNLHKKHIVHGAVTADNILFSAPQEAEDINAHIARYPSTLATDGKSQPFSPTSQEEVESVYLSNLGYARHEQGGVSTKDDIWSLGTTTYLLLTGTPLFSSSPSTSEIEKTISNLDELLLSSKRLTAKEARKASAFLKLILTINPEQRPSAYDLIGNEWLL